jgi:sugar phosphate isomerase/epimerase
VRGAPGADGGADLFHMSIEEDDLAAAILAAGPRIAHVHVDDTNRLQPGAGHMDFASVFDACGRLATTTG